VARNNLGWRFPFLIYGDLSFGDTQPLITSLDVYVGNLGKLPFFSRLVSNYLKQKINLRLRMAYSGSAYQVVFSDGFVTLSR
jgi:hypothetical protein